MFHVEYPPTSFTSWNGDCYLLQTWEIIPVFLAQYQLDNPRGGQKKRLSSFVYWTRSSITILTISINLFSPWWKTRIVLMQFSWKWSSPAPDNVERGLLSIFLCCILFWITSSALSTYKGKWENFFTLGWDPINLVVAIGQRKRAC